MSPNTKFNFFRRKPKTESTPPKSLGPLQEFTLFTSVPPEIRLLIWHFASLQPKIITINSHSNTNNRKLAKNYLNSQLHAHRKPQHGPLQYLTPESNSIYNSSRKTLIQTEPLGKHIYCDLDVDILLMRGFGHLNLMREMEKTFGGVARRVKRVAIQFPKPLVLHTDPSGELMLLMPSNLIICEIFKTFLFLEELKFVNDGVDGNRERRGGLPVQNEMCDNLAKHYKEGWKVMMRKMDQSGIPRGEKCPSIEWVDSVEALL